MRTLRSQPSRQGSSMPRPAPSPWLERTLCSDPWTVFFRLTAVHDVSLSVTSTLRCPRRRCIAFPIDSANTFEARSRRNPVGKVGAAVREQSARDTDCAGLHCTMLSSILCKIPARMHMTRSLSASLQHHTLHAPVFSLAALSKALASHAELVVEARESDDDRSCRSQYPCSQEGALAVQQKTALCSVLEK